MKRITLAFSLGLLLFGLAACSKTASQASGKSSAPLSSEVELLVGTFKLEGTDQAVTADQAKQLLPLWQTLQSLSTSNTAASEEIDAVVDQIKGTMTAAQMDKITAMKLTQQDMMSLMGQAGLSPNGASSTTTPMQLGGLPNSGNSSQGGPGGAGGPPAGGAPSGGFPSNGGSDPGFGGGPNSASGTPQAFPSNGMANRVPAPLLNALIELLQKKIK
ncbi:MAG TPA: hypothetical protein VMC09_18680 [Anaerolineales bacterium]|nr:hypothetical protein [Anaerolineales bacterium]